MCDLVVCATKDIHLWNTLTMEHMRALKGHDKYINGLVKVGWGLMGFGPRYGLG